MIFNPEFDFGTEAETALLLSDEKPILPHRKCFYNPKSLCNLIDNEWLDIGYQTHVDSRKDILIRKLCLFWMRPVLMNQGGIIAERKIYDTEVIAVDDGDRIRVIMVTAFEILRREYYDTGSRTTVREYIEEGSKLDYFGAVRYRC